MTPYQSGGEDSGMMHDERVTAEGLRIEAMLVLRRPLWTELLLVFSPTRLFYAVPWRV
tara:strand:+ start:24265 stop:24438 length:174 start_codon:yes stop_codon:yes gene_type:complete